MDLAGRLRRLCTDADRPGARLVLSCCEEAHQAERAVAGRDQLIKTGFGDAEIVEEHLFLIVIEFCDLRLDARADDEDLAAVLRRELSHFGDARIGGAVVREVIFRDVRRIDHRLCGQQIQRIEVFPVALGDLD